MVNGIGFRPPEYLSPKQGAAAAGLSVSALYQRLKGPNPPPHKRRGRIYVLPRKEFMEWAERDNIP